MREHKYLRLKNYLKEAGIPLCAWVSRFDLYLVEWLAAQAVGWGGVIGIIILPALKLKLSWLSLCPWELEWSAPHRILITSRVTMVPQLPQKPWPDPPLVLEVLLDAYTVSHPPSRPPGFPCCLSRIPSSTPGFPGCLSCILSRSRKNGKWKALLSSHSYTAKLLKLV